uniref:Uncharacterized protein n=1 Tax=Arundo donax TaxID=35708 RepID=A0A0A9FWU9_ARUDO
MAAMARGAWEVGARGVS